MVDPQNEGKAMMDAASKLQGELIAGETELKGLQQIYSNDHVRIRTLNARIAELRAQLKKMVGSSVLSGNDARDSDSSAASSSPYPSMRTLPTLGSRYADLYREAKIEEAVYAFVTQQYEMAKIQEAKEVPIVRVMDAGEVPEKKSSPFRSLIVSLSVLSALMLACCWVFGKNSWANVPANDPYRLLAAEISVDLKAAVGKVRGSVR
jgi:capsule polysaccharide export protein KpsE/RkpR